MVVVDKRLHPFMMPHYLTRRYDILSCRWLYTSPG